MILADGDEEVYDWIASEPMINGLSLFNDWGDRYDEKYYNDETDTDETWKERMLRLRGEINDDTVDFSDSYYGVTLLGWDLLKENIKTDYTELIELGEIIVI